MYEKTLLRKVSWKGKSSTHLGMTAVLVGFVGFCLPEFSVLSQKDALQWSRNPTAVEGEEPEDTADVESCGSNETSTVSGENDGKCPNKMGEELQVIVRD